MGRSGGLMRSGSVFRGRGRAGSKVPVEQGVGRPAATWRRRRSRPEWSGVGRNHAGSGAATAAQARLEASSEAGRL